MTVPGITTRHGVGQMKFDPVPVVLLVLNDRILEHWMTIMTDPDPQISDPEQDDGSGTITPLSFLNLILGSAGASAGYISGINAVTHRDAAFALIAALLAYVSFRVIRLVEVPNGDRHPLDLDTRN
mgnify:CR=1 FL=1